MSKTIIVESLTQTFGRREVLHGVSFSLEKGSVFGVIGPSGAGKTTVTRCLLDIIRPTSGTQKYWVKTPHGRAGTPALDRLSARRAVPGGRLITGRAPVWTP